MFVLNTFGRRILEGDGVEGGRYDLGGEIGWLWSRWGIEAVGCYFFRKLELLVVS